MGSIWKAARRKALLERPADTQLIEYFECFTAGYNRGVMDVRKTVRRKVWTVLIEQISNQLAKNRSALEAGCWLAGVNSGREDAIAGTANNTGQLLQHFCAAWETGSIADLALEFAPASKAIRKTLAVLWLRHEIPAINFRLRKTDLSFLEATLEQTTWEQVCNESNELVSVTSAPSQKTQSGGK